MSRFTLSRRSFLRGAAGVALALPTLECMLNGNGNAYASGIRLPKRFGVFFWGNGVRLDRWVPPSTGTAWSMSDALSPLAPIKDYVNVISNYEVKAAGPRGHHGGESGMLSGVEFIPLDHPNSGYSSKFGGPSIDQILVNDLFPDKPALALGVSKRIVTGEGPTLQFISHKGPDNPVAPEYNPAVLFTRLFGSFQVSGTVDPRAGLRANVLDAVAEETRQLQGKLGANDRARLDAHLTAVSELRQRILALPPQFVGACSQPATVTDDNHDDNGVERIHDVSEIMSDLLVMSYACDLVRSSSFMFTGSVGGTVFTDVGATTGHHDLTHDSSQAAQDMVHATTRYTVDRLSSLCQKLAATPEGDGNLLDQTLMLATSDLAEGLTHSNADYPIVLVGRAGGALRYPGLHHRGGLVSGNRRNTSDVLVTILRAMGSTRSSIGTGGSASNTAVSEVLA